jgi:hypothetical protein
VISLGLPSRANADKSAGASVVEAEEDLAMAI